ncbi:MAG TPA: hypothetical protein ENN67_05950 [Firmicutes bacterium]|nr:hypothetical protein [Bacillota bacterium]
MRFIRLIHATVAATLILSIIGCAGNPSIPENFPVDGQRAESTVSTGHGHVNLGYYLLSINTEKYKATVIPMRSAELHVNVVGVMNSTMGVSVVGVPSEADPLNGLFVFDITLTHPFPLKPQLTGFDVRGILITPGTYSIPPLVLAALDETRLENADGYARWWNPTEFTTPGMFGYTKGNLTNSETALLTSMVNPYKYYADILGPDDSMANVVTEPLDNDEGRGVFRAGNTNTRRYRIRFPMDPGPKVVYGYAIDASWNQPTPIPPTEIPDDFPINANQPEPYLINPTIVANSLYYDSGTGNKGGVLRLKVDVFDWQGQALGNLPGQVEIVRAFAPTLFAGGKTAVLENSTPYYATYSWDFYPDAVPPDSEDALLAIRVVSQDGPGYDQGVGPAPAGKVEAWQVISVDVLDPECAPDDNNDFASAEPIGFGENKTGVVCKIIDQSDFYVFTVPTGMAVNGELHVYSDDGWTNAINARIYDDTFTEINSVTFAGKSPNLFNGLNLLPDTYYLEIESEIVDFPLTYLVDLPAELINVEPLNPIDVSSSTLYVDPYYVWMHGDYAFLLGDFGVWVYDMTSPANPIQISYIETETTGRNACFSYPFCYKYYYDDNDGSDNIDFIDFTDPANPSLHESVFQLGGTFMRKMYMDSDYLFVANFYGSDNYIDIYSYTDNPANPQLKATITVSYAPSCMGTTHLPVHGKYLIVGSMAGGKVYGYNIEDTSSITALPEITVSATGAATGIATNGEWIYLSWDKGGKDGHFYMLQLAHTGFTAAGGYDVPGRANALVYDEPYVYVADGQPGFSVLRVFDPPVVDYKYSRTILESSRSIAKSGDLLCLGLHRQGMIHFLIPNPDDQLSITQYPKLKVCNSPRYMVIQDDFMYACDSAGLFNSLKIIDISDPTNPYQAGVRNFAEELRNPSIHGNYLLAYAYLSGGSSLKLIDVTDLWNIHVPDEIPVTTSVYSTAISADAFYVVMHPSDLLVYDYSSFPSTLTATIPLPNFAMNIYLYQDYLILICPSEFIVYDLADPLSPAYVDSFPVPAQMEGSAIANNKLYTVREYTLYIYDISDPANISFIDSLNVGTNDVVDRIAVENAYAYVASQDVAPSACRIHPPDDSEYLGPIYMHAPNAALGLNVIDGYLFEISQYKGVRIFKLY